MYRATDQRAEDAQHALDVRAAVEIGGAEMPILTNTDKF
jgi:hypothetical protein